MMPGRPPSWMYKLRFSWEAFAGSEVDGLLSLIERSLSLRAITSQSGHERPPHVQRFMLGVQGPRTVIRAAEAPAWRIMLLTATADPAARMWGRFVGSTASAPHTARCVLVRADADDADAWQIVEETFADVVRWSPHPPWEIHHPRFEMSPGLRWRTHRNWRRIAGTASSSTPSSAAITKE